MLSLVQSSAMNWKNVQGFLGNESSASNHKDRSSAQGCSLDFSVMSYRLVTLADMPTSKLSS